MHWHRACSNAGPHDEKWCCVYRNRYLQKEMRLAQPTQSRPTGVLWEKPWALKDVPCNDPTGPKGSAVSICGNRNLLDLSSLLSSKHIIKTANIVFVFLFFVSSFLHTFCYFSTSVIKTFYLFKTFQLGPLVCLSFLNHLIIWIIKFSYGSVLIFFKQLKTEECSISFSNCFVNFTFSHCYACFSF